MDNTLFYVVSIIVALAALMLAFWFYRWVTKQPSENKRIEEVAGWIKKGANTFIKREYLTLIYFVGVFAILIFLFLPKPIWVDDGKGMFVPNLVMMGSYIMGSVFSGIAGKIGISIATIANKKSAE